MLWGLLPPLMTLRRDARSRARTARGDAPDGVGNDGGGALKATVARIGRRVGLQLLVALGAAFVGWNAWGDVGRLVGLSTSAPRWG